LKLVILDRDGVINHDSQHYIKSADEWRPIDGSLAAIASLNQAGYHTVVATNQSGVGRNLFDIDTLNAIHGKMNKELATAGGRIDAFFYCPHPAEANCECRKPRHGLFLQIAARFNVNLQGVPAIGDSLRDLQAAAAVGCRPMLVLTGKGEQTRVNEHLPENTLQFDDLASATRHILAQDEGQETFSWTSTITSTIS